MISRLCNLAFGTKHPTTRDEGKTHTMPHIVPSHTASPRTTPGPSNVVPQDTGHAQAQLIAVHFHGAMTHAEAVPKHIDHAQTRKTEDRHPTLRQPLPNKRIQATGNKLRSCLAPLIPRA